MSIVPQLPAHVVLRKLKRAGFEVIHRRGSHAKLYHPDSEKRVTVPIHPGTLGKGLITRIIKQAGLSLEDFLGL